MFLSQVNTPRCVTFGVMAYCVGKYSPKAERLIAAWVIQKPERKSTQVMFSVQNNIWLSIIKMIFFFCLVLLYRLQNAGSRRHARRHLPSHATVLAISTGKPSAFRQDTHNHGITGQIVEVNINVIIYMCCDLTNIVKPCDYFWVLEFAW